MNSVRLSGPLLALARYWHVTCKDTLPSISLEIQHYELLLMNGMDYSHVDVIEDADEIKSCRTLSVI